MLKLCNLCCMHSQTGVGLKQHNFSISTYSNTGQSSSVAKFTHYALALSNKHIYNIYRTNHLQCSSRKLIIKVFKHSTWSLVL